MNGIKTAGGGEISCPFGAPRMTVRGVIFHYTTSQHFCQVKVDRQIAQNFSQNLVQDYYLIFLLKYIIIIIQGKERKKSQRKKIKKVLDIQSTLCYNKYVNKTKHSLKGKERIGTRYGKDDKCKGS